MIDNCVRQVIIRRLGEDNIDFVHKLTAVNNGATHEKT